VGHSFSIHDHVTYQEDGVSETELGIGTWEYDLLEDEEVVPIDTFNGVFILLDSKLSSAHYWISVSLDRVRAVISSFTWVLIASQVQMEPEEAIL
jgi:hypothetical protein